MSTLASPSTSPNNNDIDADTGTDQFATIGDYSLEDEPTNNSFHASLLRSLRSNHRSTIVAPSRDDSILCCAKVIHRRIVHSLAISDNEAAGDNESDAGCGDGDSGGSVSDPFDLSHFTASMYTSTLSSSALLASLSLTAYTVYQQRLCRSHYECPSLSSLTALIKHVFDVCGLSIECAVICILYIDRLEALSAVRLNVRNWLPLLLSTLLTASKVWDDTSSHNIDFTRILPSWLTLRHLNHLERRFLIEIQYTLYISSSEYAKYFFALRDLHCREQREERKAKYQEKYYASIGGRNIDMKGGSGEGCTGRQPTMKRELPMSL